MAEGDGNGWVRCRCGHRHWGLHGAAGLLMVRPAPAGSGGAEEVLLQLRAGWTHQGGTWALPGGAADSHESPVEAALREAHEETGVAPGALRVLGAVVGTDHGDWRYTVVLADTADGAATPQPRAANDESDEVRWVPLDGVTALPLHPGFAQGWPTVLRALQALREATTAPAPPQ